MDEPPSFSIEALMYDKKIIDQNLIFFGMKEELNICMDEPPSFSIEALMYDKKIIDQNLIFLE